MIDGVTASDLAHDRAWRTLEGRLRPFVARRVPGAEVDDVLQEIFLRIQRGLPSLRRADRLGPWVYRVARSAVADHGRKTARQVEVAADPPERAALADAGDADVAHEVAAYAALFVAMLPSPYREALTLTDLEGLTQREAAEMMGVSLSGMKSRVQRGRAKLRRALTDCCDIALDARNRVVDCQPRPDGRLPDDCCG